MNPLVVDFKTYVCLSRKRQGNTFSSGVSRKEYSATDSFIFTETHGRLLPMVLKNNIFMLV